MKRSPFPYLPPGNFKILKYRYWTEGSTRGLLFRIAIVHVNGLTKGRENLR